MSGRVDRILDTAGSLLVRFGYRRVRIKDVACAAAVGKGTVYLHVRSKDDPFMAMLLRAQRRLVDGVADRMDADPHAVLPGDMQRGTYEDIADDPVTRAVHVGDDAVLGHLAQLVFGQLDAFRTRRDAVLSEQLTLLRDAGCLRTDLTVAEQRYLVGRVSTRGRAHHDRLHRRGRLPGP
ncbi:MAG: TetR/AcrR family transcriptional regulator [Pseudonocardia sp.]|nr:TetR/AcrR family transcriptional regulator [Pseudonocardia sp.]